MFLFGDSSFVLSFGVSLQQIGIVRIKVMFSHQNDENKERVIKGDLI